MNKKYMVSIFILVYKIYSYVREGVKVEKKKKSTIIIVLWVETPSPPPFCDNFKPIFFKLLAS